MKAIIISGFLFDLSDNINPFLDKALLLAIRNVSLLTNSITCSQSPVLFAFSIALSSLKIGILTSLVRCFLIKSLSLPDAFITVLEPSTRSLW